MNHNINHDQNIKNSNTTLGQQQHIYTPYNDAYQNNSTTYHGNTYDSHNYPISSTSKNQHSNYNYNSGTPININTQIVIIYPYPLSHNETIKQPKQDNRQNNRLQYQQHTDKDNFTETYFNHHQRVEYIINYKNLVNDEIALDRLNTNQLVLFDPNMSVIQLESNKQDHMVSFKLKSNLIFKDPNPIVIPIVEKGKLKRFKLCFESIDIAKHFIIWFFFIKQKYGDVFPGAYVNIWKNIEKQQQRALLNKTLWSLAIISIF